MNVENFAQRKRDAQVGMIHDWSIGSLVRLVIAAATVVVIVAAAVVVVVVVIIVIVVVVVVVVFLHKLNACTPFAENSVEMIDCMSPLQDTNVVVLLGVWPGCTTIVQKRSSTGTQGPLAEWSAAWKPTRPVRACVRWRERDLKTCLANFGV